MLQEGGGNTRPDSAQFVPDLDGSARPAGVRGSFGLLGFGATCLEADSFKNVNYRILKWVLELTVVVMMVKITVFV